MNTLRPRLVLSCFVAGLCLASVSVAGPLTSTKPATAGLELWSLREEMKKSVPDGLKLAASLGFKDVETAGTYGLPAEEFAEMMKKAGLNPVSGHFPYDAWAKDPALVAKEAKALGLKYAGTAWISHKAPFKVEDMKRAAEVFNRAGAACAKEGIGFFYHTHGYEFQPIGGGETLMDSLIKACDPKTVSFQMDTTWVYFPGQDPAAWLRKYPGRWSSLHLKDLKKGVARGSLSGGTDKDNDVPLGQGQLNWSEIFAAAKKAGVKFYIIEDESSSVVKQLPQTMSFLKSVKY